MTPRRVRAPWLSQLSASITIITQLLRFFMKPILNVMVDLGPLTPNWFEELTAKASRKDDSDVGEAMASGPSCHEDVAIKLPGVKAEIFLGSQTSTPKLLTKPLLASPEFLTEG